MLAEIVFAMTVLAPTDQTLISAIAATTATIPVTTMMRIGEPPSVQNGNGGISRNRSPKRTRLSLWSRRRSS